MAKIVFKSGLDSGPWQNINCTQNNYWNCKNAKGYINTSTCNALWREGTVVYDTLANVAVSRIKEPVTHDKPELEEPQAKV